MEYRIRKAESGERHQIARTIAFSFEKDYSGITKDMDRFAKALESGIDVNRFIIAEQDDRMVGIIACADCTGRVVTPSKKDCRKHLGFFRGSIAFMVLKEEFIQPLTYPPTTGCIDIVGVLKESRGKGIAKALLKEAISTNPQYTEFVLNVTDINTSAIKLYESFGFVEYERVPYRFAKQAGFDAKIYMKYKKKEASLPFPL